MLAAQEVGTTWLDSILFLIVILILLLLCAAVRDQEQEQDQGARGGKVVGTAYATAWSHAWQNWKNKKCGWCSPAGSAVAQACR